MTEPTQKKRSGARGCLIAVCIAIALIGGCRLWWNHISHFETKQPLTLAESRKCKHISLPLPDTASNIWVYFKQHGPGTYTYLMRFDASVADCTTYAELVVTNCPRMAKGWKKQAFPSQYSGDSNPLPDRAPWFDIHSITNGLTWDYHYRDTDGGPSVYQSLYLDQDRGILYLFSGD